MFVSDGIVEEIRSRVDIVDVIGGYVRLQRRGNSYLGLCPFHSERTPSFSVSPQKQMYYCFGCGAGGDVFTFLMEYENLSFNEALRMLADRAGVVLPEEGNFAERKREQSRRARLLDVTKEAASYFYYQLRQKQGRPGYEYLKSRKLTDETLQRFGLGFANKYRDDLVQYLKAKGYEESLMIEAGLASPDEKYGTHDKFWNRVMFPIQDGNGRVIGFGGRVMGEGEPKYLNSPETPIFDKGRNLYGLNFARRSHDSFILCEGYMDVIAMHQAGFIQAVASLGTAFTLGQAALLKRYSEEVILCYDSDTAGVSAALRAIGILRESGLRGKVMNLRPYKDPDEFIKNLGAEAFKERIDQAENSFFFEVGVLESRYQLSDPAEKTRFHQEIAKKLCEFPEEVERENYLQAVADRYHIGADALRSLVRQYAARTGLAKPLIRPKSGIRKKDGEQDGASRAQRLLLTWLVEEPELYDTIKPYIGAEDFTDDLCRQVAEFLFADFEAGRFEPAAILGHFDEEQQREVARLFHTRLERVDTEEEREKAFHDIIYAVKKSSYEASSSKLESGEAAFGQVIAGKKALEKLERTHFSLKH